MNASTNATLPSEPRGLPVLGHLYPLAREPLEYMLHLSRTQGDLIRLTLRGKPSYVLNHPALVEKVLVTDARKFHREGNDTLRQVLGQGLLTSEGDFWRRQRQAVQPAFHHERIARYCAFFVDSTREYLLESSDGEFRDIHLDMQRLTLRNAARVLFDIGITQDMEAVTAALETIMARFDHHWFGMLPAWLLHPIERQYRKANTTLDRIVRRHIHDRKQSGVHGEDLLSMLMQARTEDGSSMSEQQVRDEILTLLMAGHETTASTLTFTWYLLSQHPEAEARVHDELDSVLGSRLPTLADLPQLPYLNQVLQEVLRMYPPGFALLERFPDEDVTLAGCRVPRGSEIQIWPLLQHRDPRFWVEPDRFLPERWTEKGAQQRPRFAFYPFGGGQRLCIGARFAQLEMALMVATIAQNYRLAAPPGERALRLHASITLRPKSKVALRFVARSPSASRTGLQHSVS
ncbi:cytochrome P450 [Stigmatella sp. ncwal1]|uniref:Cytochrome P450 n=1 Tax=Stigmatella ashevillensis TaxID=2995309 RepID=A0ABT5D2M7_9BACT|nr:cytochrome P450 [Stigmatella ashevillena]MDC0707918.1 cytochrome P450 [Stigmatella ashevillena]